MKLKTRVMFALLGLGLMMSCAQARYARTGIEQTIDNPVTQSYKWGEVQCYQGTVCAEVEVLRIDIEPRDGGKVELTLHNRTGKSVAVQVALEILDDQGVRLDITNYEDVALPPRQEQVWSMPGIARQGAKVRVLMRAR